MTADKQKKSIGQAIDEIINALSLIDAKDQMVVIQAACSHLSLKLPNGSAALAVPMPMQSQPTTASVHMAAPAQEITATSSAQTSLIDIRSLKEEKQPNSAGEMACIVSYYLSNLAPEGDKKQTVATDDLEKYFKQAGYPLPTALKQILKDAKRAGYFDSAERGEYRLNPVGYNLVVHGLPRGTGTTTVRQARKKPRAKTKNAKSKKMTYKKNRK